MKTTVLLCLLGSACLSNVCAPAAAQEIPNEASSFEERLPPKIHRIQKELPAWSEQPGNKEKATAFMQKLKEQLDAMNFAEADKTADDILKLMGVSVPVASGESNNKPSQAPSPSSPSSDMTKRLTEKVERVKAGAKKWAASGRDPSEIARAMVEKFKPLMEAGKPVKAEVELDRVLEQLGESTSAPAAPQPSPQDASSYQDRLPPKIHRIQKKLPEWIENPGNKAKATAFMQKLKEQLDSQNFAEAEKTADAILETMGLSERAASPGEAKTEALPLYERLPPKIQKIQKELPAWLEKADVENKQKAIALMQQVKEQMAAKNYEEVEKAADAILKLMATSAATSDGTSTPASGTSVSEEARREMRHNIDSSFVVFRDKVQEELKLTTEQKEKLDVVLPDVAQFLQQLHGLKPEDRKNELKAYRPKAREELAAALKETLDEGQRTRLRQLVRQREGLRNGEIWKELQVTDEQQKQFMTLIQQTHKETQTLLDELKNGGARKEEIQPKVIKVREDLEDRLNALLTDAQRKQWQEMLGKPMDVADLFDL